MPEPEPALAQAFQDVLDSALETHGGTGVSAAVIITGQGIWRGVGGMSEPATTERIRPDMLFEVASIGKNYLAALALRLAEHGQFDLEDRLRKWLPDYPHINNTITIRQLLNHTSGVFDFVEHPQSPYRTPFNAIDFTRVWTPAEVLTTLVCEPYFPPGSGWHYSTTNYILLKMIVEEATASTLPTELRQRFLEPLDLNYTVPVDFEQSIPSSFDLAHNWFDTDGDGTLDDVSLRPRTWWQSMSPHLIYATAADLARWSHALFRGEALDQSSLDQMLEFHRPTPGEPLYTGYGLGTAEFPAAFFSTQVWGHLGWGYGAMGAMLYFPDYSVSIAVLINDNNEGCITMIAIGLWSILKNHLTTV